MDERRRARDAAHLAIQLYPGPVGEVLAAELRSWDGFGYLIGAEHALITRLVEHIEQLHGSATGTNVASRTTPVTVMEAA